MRKSVLLLSAVVSAATCFDGFATNIYDNFVAAVGNLELKPELVKRIENPKGLLCKKDLSGATKLGDAKKLLIECLGNTNSAQIEQKLAPALVTAATTAAKAVTPAPDANKEKGKKDEVNPDSDDDDEEASANPDSDDDEVTVPASPSGGKHAAVVEREKLEKALSTAEDQLNAAKKAKKGVTAARHKVALAQKKLDAFDVGGKHSEGWFDNQDSVAHALSGINPQVASKVAPVLDSALGLEDDAFRVLLACLQDRQKVREQQREMLVLQQLNGMLPRFNDVPEALKTWLQGKLNAQQQSQDGPQQDGPQQDGPQHGGVGILHFTD
ncbi:hypothetical protein FACS1894122_06160 [Alphaproteobacteria bacterium]|nr:hypothetical protein FACS1894122_06160 [Alphaproteobacteria bacterium]